MFEKPNSAPLSIFHPLGVGVRTGMIAVNTTWPFRRLLAIYREGLAFRSLSAEAWVPRDQIRMLVHGLGLIEVKWWVDNREAAATASDWFRIRKIIAALEAAGYRVDPTEVL